MHEPVFVRQLCPLVDLIRALKSAFPSFIWSYVKPNPFSVFQPPTLEDSHDTSSKLFIYLDILHSLLYISRFPTIILAHLLCTLHLCYE